MIRTLLSAIVFFFAATGTLPAQQKVSPPSPLLPVPNAAQLRWHKAEYLMFVHFGMKTFYPSNDHMGYGIEDPRRFNPVHFDADQWAAAAKAGGFKGIVITAAIDIELGRPAKIDGFILQEYIPLGQRVEDYSIECRVGGKWTVVFTGKRIGYKRIILEGRIAAKNHKFPVADAVRLRINKAGAAPLINNFQVISLYD